MSEKSILNTRQRRWYAVMAAATVFLTANGIYLWIYDGVDLYYMSHVLAHLAIGLLFAVPFLLFSIDHFLTSRRARNARSKFVGYVLFAIIAVAIATGVYLMLVGVRRDQQWILWVHIASTFFAVGGFALHRITSSHGGEHPLARYKETGYVIASLAVLLVAHGLTRPRPEAAPAAQPVSFSPSPIQTSTGRLLDADALADNESCKECHPDSYAQWQSSIHAKAAYNADPYHQRTFKYMLRTADPNLIRFCSGCHDPVLLTSGQMQQVDSNVDFSRLKYANAGITCNGCHAIVSIDKRGNGGYTLAEPPLYPFAHDSSAIGKFLNALLIKVKPEAHRAAYMKPFHKTSEFCAVCHKLAIPEAVNNYKWMRGQNQYDVWHNSGISKNSAVSWYSAPEPFSACQQCHMKGAPSGEFGSMNGMIPNHWTPAANSAMAVLSRDTAWLARTKAFLRAGRVSVDCFAAVIGSPGRQATIIAPLSDRRAVLPAGASARVDVVIRTKLVGHRFPECTVDINEVRVELRAIDRQGTVFFHSGGIDPKTHDTDPRAHFVRNRLFTRGDTLIDKHNINDWTGTLYNNAIPPGSAQTVHYRIPLPNDPGGTVTFVTQLHYRKFNAAYTSFALEGFDTSGIGDKLPFDIEMCADTVTVALGNDAAVPPLDTTAKLRGRMNDYAIGLFMQGDIRGATAAFTAVTSIDPRWGDGFVNVARCAIEEGDLPRAQAWLDRAESAQPDFYKTHYFRGMLHKLRGEYPDALKEYGIVAERFPLDRATITAIARLHYLTGDYQKGLEWCRKELTIDPEDFTAHYNAALCFRALGQTDSAQFHEQEHHRYRPDEKVNQYALPYRLSHPDENTEADPIHEHS